MDSSVPAVVAEETSSPVAPQVPMYSSSQDVSGTISSGAGSRPSPSHTNVPLGGRESSNSTLDEPVWHTVRRDLLRVMGNVKVVLFPGYAQMTNSTHAMKDWDLWGPLVFTLVLAVCLSEGNPKAGSIFSVVIILISLGAVILTMNVILLGGHIQFFQAVSLLGYCLFPLNMVAIISLFVSNVIARGVMILVALPWCFWAAIPFVSGSVPERRRALAVYPVMLMYTALSWLALTL